MNKLFSLLQHAFSAGRGRPAAAFILLWLIILSVLSERTYGPDRPSSLGDRTVRMLTTPFVNGRQLLFDNYQQISPRRRESQPVTIVEIDEASLKAVGQWPWPRNRLADLVDAIAAQGPAAIGLDMYMPEPDATSPARVAANLPAGQAKLARALSKLPNHEARLAASLSAAPTVIGAAGFDFETQTTAAGLRTAPVIARGGDPLPHLRRFPWVLASLPELQAAAHGQALLSVSLEDSVVRRIPLVMAVGDQAVPSLAMEMLRVATGSSAIELDVGAEGIETVSVADLAVPTQSGGDIWLHFGRRAGSTPREVSAADVLAGRVAREAIEGKLVLVGLTGSGLQDMRTTPLRELVPGIEIQAQTIEALFDGRRLLRPGWLKNLELAILAGFGALMIWLAPSARTSRVPAGLVLGFNALLVTGGFLAFRTTGLLFDAASLIIVFSILLASLVSSTLIEIGRENQRLAEEQQRLREESARVSGELAAARMIQMASLPQAARLFAGETRFGVAAMLEPAREVGGDLYDFYMLDDRHLFFVIGDVSGKGVPASLFMAVTKALAKSAARRGGLEPERILATASREIGEENPESMFVTMVAGILDAETGRLLICNAGHDAPFRLRASGAIDRLGSASGPPLCVLDGFPYRVEEFRLEPGDLLLLFTDGLTEARNEAGELYGMKRVQDALEGGPMDAESLIVCLRENLRAFVGAAEPADDLTLLALRRTPAV